MNNNDYRVFQILAAIDQDDNVSQRRLADQLNISLGLVNSFVKRLVKKGYFKAVTIPKKRVKYILTPEGAAEKTRLTYNYIKHSYALYNTSYNKIKDIFQTLEVEGVESVYFYGATDIAEIACVSLRGTEIVLSGVIDDAREGEIFLECRVARLDNINLASTEKIIITANDFSLYLIEKFTKNGINNDQIVTFD